MLKLNIITLVRAQIFDAGKFYRQQIRIDTFVS